MTECAKKPVEIKVIDDERMKDIKEIAGIKADQFGRPPVLVLAFNKDGRISVIRSEEEFNSHKDLCGLTHVNTVGATFITTEQDRTLTKAIFYHNPGGESLTDSWPW